MNSIYKALPGTSVRIAFADGTPEIITEYRSCAFAIANRYDVSESDLVWQKCDECGDQPSRELVWLSEADADNDDGAKAVAAIYVA